jgi:hypothetical protein
MFELTCDDLMERLLRLDEDAYLSLDTDERYQLVIVGGGALILQRYIVRATHDLDVISVSPKLVSLLEKYDINCRVQAFINNFPYNYENRLVPLLKGRKIDFFTASLEDIVIAKLYSLRPVDQSDIQADEVLKRLDWDLLNKLAFDEYEAKASALNDQNYADFKVSYENYTRRYRPCES